MSQSQGSGVDSKPATAQNKTECKMRTGGKGGEREEEIMEALVKCSLKVNSAFRLKKSPYFAQRSSVYIVRKISVSVRHSGLEDIIENIQCSFNWE